MIKATIEIDNGTHVVLLQDEEGNKMVTSVLPLLDMIKSGKEIAVEGDNVVAGKVKDYIINLKENLDIMEDIKEMVGRDPETVIPVNFMNKVIMEGYVCKVDGSIVSPTPTIDKYFEESGHQAYFYHKIDFNPSSDVIDKMNEANEPMLKLKSNNGMINHFLKCDFMTVNENIDTYYFFYKDKVVATCSMKSYDDMVIAITPREWITGINHVIDGELSMVTYKYNDLLKEEERDMTLSVNWMTLHGRRGNINRSEEGEYRLVFEDEEYHMVMLPTLHGNFVPLARIEQKGMMVMVVNIYSPDGYKWNAKVDDTPFKNEGATTPEEALTGLFEYVKDHKIPVEELNKLGIYSNTTTIGSYGKYTMINVQVAVRFEDIAVQGGEKEEEVEKTEEEPTLDVLFVFFNVKDISGELVPHFMVPSLTTDNAYIMEEGHDDPVSLVKKALGEYKLSEGDMEYLGWEGDTPPRITKEDVKDMVHVDDCVLVTRKVPRKLIARE